MAICAKCKGTRWVEISKDHLAVCDACCVHPLGFVEVPDGFSQAGKYMCKAGCGKLIDKLPPLG